MKKLIFISWLIALIAGICSCAASNKAHWLKVHPKGAYAGKNWINGIDTTNTVKK